MCSLLLASSWEDSLTVDENPHITAGYTYLRLRDARLNPEHPPLLKILAAVPLLSLPLNFPLAHPAWQDDDRQQDPQWPMSRVFLYESNNDPHRIAVWARLAPILLTVLLGLLLFRWARRFACDGTALLTLLLYTLSPTVLAHGRYVTTDVPAALGVALAGLSFIRFLAAPSRNTALVSGLALGTALLFKFSIVLLVPLLVTLTLLWSGCLSPRGLFVTSLGSSSWASVPRWSCSSPTCGSRPSTHLSGSYGRPTLHSTRIRTPMPPLSRIAPATSVPAPTASALSSVVWLI